MTTAQSSVTAAIESSIDHWHKRPATVRQIAHMLGVRQSDIAKALNITRQTLNTRMNGAKVFEPWELDGIAVLFNVPRLVLDMEPKQAIDWLYEFRREMLRNLCFLFGSLVAA